MSAYILADRYVSAYSRSFNESERLSALNQLHSYSSSFLTSQTVLPFLAGKQYTVKQKQSFLNELLGDRFPILKNLFLLLTIKNRIQLLPSIVVIVDQHIRSLNNIKDIEVVTRTELSEDLRTQLTHLFKNLTSSDVNIHESIDPNFSPGFKARFDNYILDATLDHVLNTFRNRVKTVSNTLDFKEEEGSE